MIGLLRKERDITIGDFCETKTEVKEKIYSKYWGRKGTYLATDVRVFNLFYVVKDNFLGIKDLCLVVPIQHSDDYSSSDYYFERTAKQSKYKTLIVSKSSMRVYTRSIQHKLGFANDSRFNTHLKMINDKFNLGTTLYKIPVD